MIDGVVASCYPSVHHDLGHIAMTPLHWFPRMTKWIFGDDNGFTGYALINEELGRWLHPNGQL